ncbi:MAG: NFACT RNA binding domain-containing protein [Candidatus Pacearchaeota archaeon]|nr:NFACT RNA binding domain-containing protein [Candidatus Pacearchaeota archaeon]
MGKFRELVTKTGTRILAGKDEKSNEELVKQAGENEEIFHTEAPGSPFVNIKGKAKESDIKIAAVFCARHSRDWKKNRRDVFVHRFKGKDVFKTREMKTGTFGVKKFKIMKIKKADISKLK